MNVTVLVIGLLASGYAGVQAIRWWRLSRDARRSVAKIDALLKHWEDERLANKSTNKDPF